MPDTDRLLPAADQIRVRLYSQGLGDCFLLAFPRPANADLSAPCYVLIDCGAAVSTPGRAERAEKVVRNILSATGGHIDILVITHQHYDHISGFQDAWQLWRDEFTIDQLYLPWCDATAESKEADTVSKFREVLERAAQQVHDTQGEAAPLDLGAPENPDDMDETMAFIRSLSVKPPRYFSPGEVFRLPGTDSHGYVLGPPRTHLTNEKGKPYIEVLSDEAPGVMYSYGDLHMPLVPGTEAGHSFALSDDRGLPAAASGILAAGTLQDSDLRDSDDCYSPFAPELRLDWDGARAAGGFFGGTYEDPKEKWRKIDDDWLLGAASMGLRAGNFTNNTSMVLAFDQPGSEKMLLFPGDAQVGNWLSWHSITGWSFKDTPASTIKPPAAKDGQTLMENLLSRVAFYKAGHHGSHNATIKDKGLAKMIRADLTAYVPVSIPVAQNYMSYCPMPFYPVVRALQTATQGRVFLPSGKAIEPLPGGANTDDAQAALRASAHITLSETILPMIQGEDKEGDEPGLKNVEEMPLYLEYTQSRG